jgi:hypothetical protein
MYEKDTFKMIDKREMLRVKIKSLTAEAAIIRIEEKRAAKCAWLRAELTFHRKEPLRNEARASFVAYGLIKSRTLEQIEPNTKTEPDWVKVRAMIKAYGPKDFVYPDSMTGKGEKIKPVLLADRAHSVTSVPVTVTATRTGVTFFEQVTKKPTLMERVFGRK